jgi:predicted Fe-Mo cluster-binding NifX family protein
MKICVPTKTKDGKTAEVYEHFGSAPFFTIYDTESKTVEVIDNSNQHHDHGMCQPLNALANQHIDVVVTGGMGARAVQKLNEGGIKTFRGVGWRRSRRIMPVRSMDVTEIGHGNGIAMNNWRGHCAGV